MVEDHIGLADGIARSVLERRNVPAHVEREEVVAVAREALVKACDSFDPSYGVPARHWISVRVWGAVIDTLRAMSPKTRHEHGHGLERAHRPVMISLSTPVGDNDGDVLGDVLPGDGVDPFASARQEEVRRKLRKLGKRHRRILFRSFFEGCSAAEIAKLEGLSEERVRVLRRDALVKLGRVLGIPPEEEEEMVANLSEIELDVLRGTALGESAGETAGRLSRSIETIKHHRRRIIQKLQAKNMCHALTIGFQFGLLEPSALRVGRPPARRRR